MVAAATALDVEAQEACGRCSRATTVRQKNELSKELLGFGTGLAEAKQKFGHV